jgi:hypothetical protein
MLLSLALASLILASFTGCGTSRMFGSATTETINGQDSLVRPKDDIPLASDVGLAMSQNRR